MAGTNHNPRINITERASEQPGFETTVRCLSRLIDDSHATAPMPRETIKAELATLCDTAQVQLSSDTAKAIDSMIDVIIIAKRHHLIGGDAGLPKDFLTTLLATLYLAHSPDVRIDRSELTHVPLVIEGALDALCELKRRTGTPASLTERKTVFLAALIHDAGKWDLNVRTVSGLVFSRNSPFNPYRTTIELAPGESLREAITRYGFDPARLPIMGALLLPVLAHPDALAVKRLVDEWCASGFVDTAQARRIWSCVNAQAFVSSWTVRNALSESGMRARIFDADVSPEEHKFLAAYMPLAEDVRHGKTPDELEAAAISIKQLQTLRMEAARLGVERLALMLGDHQGQNDVLKYLDIHTLKPAARKMSVHELIFGYSGRNAEPRSMNGWMENSIRGTLLTHAYEQRLICPEVAVLSHRGFDTTLAWLEAPSERPGLSQTIAQDENLLARYEAWRTDQSEPNGVLNWLEHVPVFRDNAKSGTYQLIRRAIESGFYAFYAPDPAHATPSRIAIAS